MIRSRFLSQPCDYAGETQQGPKGDTGDTGRPGPPGPTGPAAAAIPPFDQMTAASIWNINHGLNKFPSVITVDSSGDVVEGIVDYIDANNIRVTFSAAFAGTAYLN